MKDKKIFSANRSVKFPLFMVFILFVALIVLIATKTYSDEIADQETCDEILAWLVDGNFRPRVVITTNALNKVSLYCLGREADVETTHPEPESIKRTEGAISI